MIDETKLHRLDARRRTRRSVYACGYCCSSVQRGGSVVSATLLGFLAGALTVGWVLGTGMCIN